MQTWAITGEGCTDRQTAMGKAPTEVARPKKHGKKVMAFCGSIDPSFFDIKDDLFDGFLAVTPPGASPELASEWLQQAVFEHFTSNGAIL